LLQDIIIIYHCLLQVIYDVLYQVPPVVLYSRSSHEYCRH